MKMEGKVQFSCNVYEPNLSTEGTAVSVLNELSTTPWRHMEQWMYRSTFS
jgi:hypothetical protein